MSHTILLVDDEESIRKVLGISLVDRGYQVIAAGDGYEALRLFEEIRPDIILTDIKMPGMTGIDLLRRIKSLSPDTEVIMISGHGDMNLAIKSLKNDATDFITKPINEDSLEIALNRALERIEMRRRLKAHTDNLENLVREQSERLVQAERIAAVSKVFESISAAVWDLAANMNIGLSHLNDMPCLAAIHNPDLKVVAVNRLFKERIGEKVGCDSWEIYAGNAANPAQCPAALTFRTGAGRRSREVIRYGDNAEIPVIVHTSPIRNTHGQVELVLEISADITEVKRLQEQLAVMEQSYRQLFDTAPCYITVQDRNLNITAANQLFKNDFNFADGGYCYRIYKNRSEPCPECPVIKTFEDGQSRQAEMVVTPGRGGQCHLLVSTSPLRNPAGDIVQVMEMATDITQIRTLQNHLSALGLKISAISHHIKGILTGLDGGGYLVESGLRKNEPEKIREGWDIVKVMVSRIRQMVLDILFYAKEREPKREPVPILNFAHEVADNMESLMEAHQIAFIRRFDPQPGEMCVDSGFLRSALVNILENAVDACLDQKGAPPQITFAVSAENDQIVFDIADNGIGMDDHTQHNLFNLFFSAKGEKGTGLGLFIAHNIIRQHGGSIRVESETGKGSCFTVKIPRNTAE